MSTSASYTHLENVLLFRAIAEFYLDFKAISDALTDNFLIKDDATYEPERLKADRLQELFLDHLWEELKIEKEATARPDGALSPASKKRRLQPPPRPTIKDAIRYGEKIQSAHNRLYLKYRREVIHEVRDLENDWDRIQKDIDSLVKEQEEEEEEEKRRQIETKAREDAARARVGDINGVQPSPPVPSPAPVVAQPRVAQPAPQRPATLVPAPAPTQAASQRPTPTPPAPVLAQPQATPSARPLQPGAPQQSASRPQDTSRLQNGPSPVLQPPQGLPAFQPAGFIPSPQAPVSQVSGGLQQPGDAQQQQQQQQQHRPPQNLQAPAAYSQPPVGHPGPAHHGQPDLQRGYASPYQAPRSAIPDHIQQQQRVPSTPTPTPPARLSIPSHPQTPATFGLQRLITGSGTKWSTASTPSTPVHGPSSRFTNDVPESPSFEPLSPPLQPTNVLPTVTPAATTTGAQQPAPSKPAVVPQPSVETPPPKRKVGRPRVSHRAQDAISPPKPAASPLSVPPLTIPSNSASTTPAPNLLAPPGPVSSISSPRASIENRSIDEVAQPENEPESAKIKDEVTTPRPLTETGDTTADESVTGPRQAPRSSKRKRDELSPTPVQTPTENQPFTPEPSGPSQAPDAVPNRVRWTRHFNKVSGSAMEQIVHHRSANMFAAPIRERDAPGYHKVIVQPQDLKSIKAAINAGNRSAAQAAAALPGGDSNSSSVWLPCSDVLVPPKGIINSGQLDRELAHMFANAIMYNPDPGHGPGHTFLVRSDEEGGDEEGGGQEGTLGYQVDEFGVVNDARAMSSEVEKLLSELRSAEVRRKIDGRTGATTGTSTRQASVAQREASQAGDEVNTNADGDDEHTEAETGTTAKRRRTTRG
ncbi:hypothetical protein OQA88_11230 [Cercophora sp. LCS_1]